MQDHEKCLVWLASAGLLQRSRVFYCCSLVGFAKDVQNWKISNKSSALNKFTLESRQPRIQICNEKIIYKITSTGVGIHTYNFSIFEGEAGRPEVQVSLPTPQDPVLRSKTNKSNTIFWYILIYNIYIIKKGGALVIKRKQRVRYLTFSFHLLRISQKVMVRMGENGALTTEIKGTWILAPPLTKSKAFSEIVYLQR